MQGARHTIQYTSTLQHINTPKNGQSSGERATVRGSPRTPADGVGFIFDAEDDHTLPEQGRGVLVITAKIPVNLGTSQMIAK